MYLTSFIHREELFAIAERWFRGDCDPGDALRLTEILISDGYVIGETLNGLAERFVEIVHGRPFSERRIHFKGELRDAICKNECQLTSRLRDLFLQYRKNPAYFYREAPINGLMYLNDEGGLLGVYRLKRPKRIAEKANRHIANWMFDIVRTAARQMALDRARFLSIPIERLVTSEEEMLHEFVTAEEAIAQNFGNGSIRFDKDALTIDDVGGIKIIADQAGLERLEEHLNASAGIRVIEREQHDGNFRAINITIEVPWEADLVCRRYSECRNWEKYLGRGIPEDRLKKGLAPLLDGGASTLRLELILSTFPDMVESELGNSIHEERIIAQRDNRDYKGYIPMNIEFLLEYLFAVGFSPVVDLSSPPIKLWGRYLPDTLGSYIRRLHRLPEFDLFY